MTDNNAQAWDEMAQAYMVRAAENLALAEHAETPQMRDRHLEIARRYLDLAREQVRKMRPGFQTAY